MSIRAKKHLAQHFLTDEHVIARIVTAIAARPDETIIEIGPGLGALTAPLLRSGARLVAVEIDATLATRLTQQFAQYKETFTLHHQDALTFDFSSIVKGGKARVIGNLPYNISTPLLMHLFNACEHIHDMHLMLQTEVAERVVAKPGTRDYSRLSIAATCFTESLYLFDIAPSSFSPPPRVNSTLLRLLPRPCLIEPQRQQAFFDLVKRAFSQRRKTLGRIFAGTLSDDDFAQLDLRPTARPETLGINDFLAMLNLLEAGNMGTTTTENNDHHEKPIRH